MDLNIMCRSLLTGENMDENELIQAVRTAFKLGYEVVALNTVIGPEQLEGKGSKIPEPLIITLGNDGQNGMKISGRSFKTISRLTAVVKDNNHCAKLIKSPVLNKYDIVAVDPQNLKVFQHICNSIEVDLISFDLTCKPKFHMKSNNLKQATSRGICFEIQYAPCLRGQESSRYTIANANLMNELLHGKDIVVSSGAKKMIELRGPFDISYLVHGVFGLKEDKAKATIRSNCKKVLLRSEIRRKTGKGIVSVQDIAAVSEDDRWLRDACTFVVNVNADRESSSDLLPSDEEGEDDEKSEIKDSPEKPAKRIKLSAS